ASSFVMNGDPLNPRSQQHFLNPVKIRSAFGNDLDAAVEGFVKLHDRQHLLRQVKTEYAVVGNHHRLQALGNHPAEEGKQAEVVKHHSGVKNPAGTDKPATAVVLAHIAAGREFQHHRQLDTVGGVQPGVLLGGLNRD